MAHVNYSALWKAYRKAAAEAEAKGELAIAETMLRRALREAEEASELDKCLLNDIHSLASQHCANRNYENAERLYRSVLEAREKLFGPYHADVHDSLERLCIVLRESAKQNEARMIGYRAFPLKTRA